MKTIFTLSALALAATVAPALAQDTSPGFFITSQNPGSGGDFGGLEGADAHCASLAEAAGITGKTWAAYLSTADVNARDRIGSGPWYNTNGELIAEDVDTLHGDANGITKETALDETGTPVNGRGDTPNRHDILTGSMSDGTAAAETCENWTSNAEDTAGMVGHHDRMGLDDTPPSKSWNASHSSRGGCGLEALNGTGGDGLLYCFATN